MVCVPGYVSYVLDRCLRLIGNPLEPAAAGDDDQRLLIATVVRRLLQEVVGECPWYRAHEAGVTPAQESSFSPERILRWAYLKIYNARSSNSLAVLVPKLQEVASRLERETAMSVWGSPGSGHFQEEPVEALFAASKINNWMWMCVFKPPGPIVFEDLKDLRDRLMDFVQECRPKRKWVPQPEEGLHPEKAFRRIQADFETAYDKLAQNDKRDPYHFENLFSMALDATAQLEWTMAEMTTLWSAGGDVESDDDEPEEEPEGHTFNGLMQRVRSVGSLGVIIFCDKALACNPLTLEDINLSKTHDGISSNAAKSLKEVLLSSKTLKVLRLARCKISPEGAAILSEALESNLTLKELDLSHNGIGNAGAEALSKALRSNQMLQDLSLSSNEIGNEGITALCEALVQSRNSSLEKLHLRKNCIGDKGAICLHKCCLGAPQQAESAMEPALVSRHREVSISLQLIDLQGNRISQQAAGNFIHVRKGLQVKLRGQHPKVQKRVAPTVQKRVAQHPTLPMDEVILEEPKKIDCPMELQQEATASALVGFYPGCPAKIRVPPSADEAQEPVHLVHLRLSRYSEKIVEAVLLSRPAQDLLREHRKREEDLSPSWAGGALILVAGLGPEDLRNSEPRLDLKRSDVVVSRGDENSVCRRLKDIPFGKRPGVKQRTEIVLHRETACSSHHLLPSPTEHSMAFGQHPMTWSQQALLLRVPPGLERSDLALAQGELPECPASSAPAQPSRKAKNIPLDQLLLEASPEKLNLVFRAVQSLVQEGRNAELVMIAKTVRELDCDMDRETVRFLLKKLVEEGRLEVLKDTPGTFLVNPVGHTSRPALDEKSVNEYFEAIAQGIEEQRDGFLVEPAHQITSRTVLATHYAKIFPEARDGDLYETLRRLEEKGYFVTTPKKSPQGRFYMTSENFRRLPIQRDGKWRSMRRKVHKLLVQKNGVPVSRLKAVYKNHYNEPLDHEIFGYVKFMDLLKDEDLATLVSEGSHHIAMPTVEERSGNGAARLA